MISLLCALWLALPAQAQILWSSVDEVVSVTVRSGWREADGTHIAALEFRMAHGWKTYWRSPGATGIAPQFAWRGTRNAGALSVEWPTPKVMVAAGEQALGFPGSFILPLRIRTDHADQPVRLRGTLSIGVCLDICLPAEVRISAVLPPVGAPDPAIAAALLDRPGQGRGQVVCVIRPTEAGLMLVADIPLATPLGSTEAVAVELANARDRTWITDTETSRTGATLKTRTEFMRPGNAPLSIDRRALRFTVVGARGAVEYFGCTGG
jgi:hypothetical protein